MIGADVNHPAPGMSSRPSIAAVTASLDPYFSRYCASIKPQRHRQEVIDDLAPTIKNLLKQWWRANGIPKDANGKPVPPERIIFMRDGVSEGQFKQVIQAHLPYMQEVQEGSYTHP